MLSYLMLICGFLAGIFIFLGIYDDIESYFHIKINWTFIILILITMFLGVYITGNIHLSEAANFNSNANQKVGIYTCFFEDKDTCNSIVNTINNDNYNLYQDGKVRTFNAYLPFSLIEQLKINVFTYFCLGMILSCIGLLIYTRDDKSG
jgi:hypothetical protein